MPGELGPRRRRRARDRGDPTLKAFHILSLGGGRQSTALYAMFARGQLKPQLTAAVFADTQEEPAWVYENLKWMQGLNGPPILIRTKGRLGDDLIRGMNSTGQRFVSIPAFTLAGQKRGMVRRQCTAEYKLRVIGQTIRREIVGLKPGRSVRRGTEVHQYIGFSIDEPERAARMKPPRRNWFHHFPLIELGASSQDCQRFVQETYQRAVKRSACVFCPFREDAEWIDLRDNDPAGWQRANEVDRGLRMPGAVVNRNMEGQLFIHAARVPLIQVELVARPQTRAPMASECLGMCGL